MKITKQRLREIIKEELKEAYSPEELHARRKEVNRIINAPRPGAEELPIST